MCVCSFKMSAIKSSGPVEIECERVSTLLIEAWDLLVATATTHDCISQVNITEHRKHKRSCFTSSTHVRKRLMFSVQLLMKSLADYIQNSQPGLSSTFGNWKLLMGSTHDDEQAKAK